MAMATSLLSLFLFSTMLASAFGNTKHFSPLLPKDDIKEAAVIEGMVYCQNCTHKGTWSLENARPLPSAKVGISCKDHKNRVAFYKAVRTDGHGYYYSPLEGLNLMRYYKGALIHACTARLLSSPDGNCNILTNINDGIVRTEIQYANKTVAGKGYKAVIYAAGPLAFRPNNCAPLKHY